MGISNNIVENIIMNDLELIGRNKLKDIAKKYKISIEKCKEAIEIIRHLDPKPGRACSNDKCVYVQPDVIVDKIDGKYIVHTNEKDVYNIKINDFYRNMMTDKDSDKEAKEFIKDRLNSAATLIKNIESRKSTILRIAEAIIDEQQEFIQKGEKYIKPMKMKDIADKLEIHESTVSKDRLNSAATLIKNIESRKSTILRIAEAIIDEQQEFIQKGEKYIKPMNMKDIADKL